MTPAEWKFFEGVLEATCQHAYEKGYADGLAGNERKPGQFKMLPSNRLLLRTALQKHVEKR